MTASTTSLTTALQVPQAPALRPARDSFWTRIAAELAEAIGSGVYPPGQRLPSEHALAEQFGVNRHTIRRCGRFRMAAGSIWADNVYQRRPFLIVRNAEDDRYAARAFFLWNA